MSSRVKFVHRIRKSFSFKMMALFGFSVFSVLCLTSLVFIYNQSEELHDRMLRRGKLLMDVLSTDLVHSVFAENRMMIDRDVLGILRQRYILSVRVVTSGGTVLADERKDKTDREIGRILAGFSGNEGRKWQDGPFRIHEIREAFSVRKPIVLHSPIEMEEALFYDEIERPKGEDVIGYVEMAFDKRDLDDEVFMLFLKGVPVAIVLIIAVAVLLFWMVRRSMRPLDNLTHAVDALGKMGAAERIPVETDDEIGRLASSFNTMTENLKRREAEKEALEEKLVQSRKLEAVGTFARGIAHDFNNILSTIKGAVFIIEKKYPDHAEMINRLEPVKNSLGKARSLIDSLLTFSRRRRPDLQQIPLNIFIRKMGPAIRTAAGDKVEVLIETKGNGMHIMADSIQLEQVLLNLAGNAGDAMPDGGTLVLKTGMVLRPVLTARHEEAPEGKGRAGSERDVKDGRAQAGYAEISLRDSGTGMDHETMTKIFEPFFTTKETGKGTGLGLAIVYGIVEQHGGYIEVDSREGEGTEFRIYLPLISEESGGWGNGSD